MQEETVLLSRNAFQTLVSYMSQFDKVDFPPDQDLLDNPTDDVERYIRLENVTFIEDIV